jgi:Ca2+-binding RTX toxin-like protein
MGVVVMNRDQSMYSIMFDYYDGSNQIIAQSSTVYAIRDGIYDTYYYGNVTSYDEGLPVSGTLNSVYGYESGALTSYAYGFNLSIRTFISFSNDVSRLQYALSGNDTIYGFNGYQETLFAGGGSDTMYALGGNDLIYGEAGNDTILTGEGYDTAYGGSGNDAIYNEGYAGDIMVGDAGADVLYGAAGADTLYGGTGIDYLFGGGGEDILVAGSDNDTLVLSDGYDYAYGEAGRDTFYINAASAQEIDYIMDFSRAQSDKIAASSYMAELGYSVSVANAFAWGYLNIYQAADAAYLYFDTNGSAAGGSVTFLAYVYGVNAGNFGQSDII